MEVVRCKGQVGYPPSVAADSQSGFLVWAYQPAELLFDRREGSGHILVRLEGMRTRAHKAGKGAEPTQRATVGFYSCCALPTHIAIPSQYAVGDLSRHRARVAPPLMEHGPWAGRYFAASLYAQG